MLLTAQLKNNYYICYNKKYIQFFRKYITKYNSRGKFTVLNYILGECYIFSDNIYIESMANKYISNIYLCLYGHFCLLFYFIYMYENTYFCCVTG